jgi:hypothetical protein
MKSIIKFAKEISVEPKIINRFLISHGINIVEDYKKSDGLFSAELYDSYIKVYQSYGKLVDEINLHNMLDASIPLESVKNPVIYALSEDKKIVYVGQSVRLLYRLNEHLQTKKFNGIAVVAFDKNDLDIVEMMYILKHKPLYNISGSPFDLFSLIFKKVL